METIQKNPKDLAPNPWNTNRVGPENMKKLKTSITELGFCSAVVCRELPNGSLQILGGHHRVEAAIELGIKSVPVLNLGAVSDDRAKKIGLVDNSRYGTDDTISLAKLLDELGASTEDLASFLPFSVDEFETVRQSVDIDLDSLEMHLPEDDEDPEELAERGEKPAKTHDVLRFRVSLGDAERIRRLIEKTIKKQGFSEEDDLTSQGDALAHLLLNSNDD